MAMLNSVTSTVTKYMPKMISPKAHELADYLLTASFLLTGALFLRKNRRASVAAFLCGGAGLTLSLLTDYSGEGRKPVSFPFHGKLELGIAAMSAAMPEFMAFEENRERTAFFVQSGAISAINNLTDFDRGREFRSARRRMARRTA